MTAQRRCFITDDCHYVQKAVFRDAPGGPALSPCVQMPCLAEMTAGDVALCSPQGTASWDLRHHRCPWGLPEVSGTEAAPSIEVLNLGEASGNPPNGMQNVLSSDSQMGP